MPRAGGTYTLPAGNPVVTLTVISSAWANTTMADIATALTGSLPTDGSAPMTGALRLVDGAVGTPGLTWGSETTSGWFRKAAGVFGFSVGASEILEVAATGLQVLVTAAAVLAITATSLTASAAGTAYLTANANGTTVPAINFGAVPGTLPVNGWYLSAANTVTLNTNSLPHGSVNANGNWNIPVPVAGSPLSLSTTTNSAAISVVMATGGAAGNFAQIVNANATNTLILSFQQGLLASWALTNAATTNSMQLASTAGGGTTWGPNGNVTIAAPVSGVSVTVTGNSASSSIVAISGTNAAPGILSQGGSVAIAGSIGIQDGQAGTRLWTLNSGAAGAGFFTIRDVTAGNLDRLTISTSGDVSIAAGAGNTLTVTGASGQNAGSFTGSSVSGTSFGPLILAGTTVADAALRVFNQSGGLNYFRVIGDGGVVVGNPTGGSQAVGTLNASAYWLNGFRLPVPLASGPYLVSVGTPTGSAIAANFPGASASLTQCSAAIAAIVTAAKTAGWFTT